MAKQDRFYFDNFITATETSRRAAEFLLEKLTDYNYDNMPVWLGAMHEIEHAGDTKRHEMAAALAKAFVTPVDREDLDEISHRIDNVTDCLEEILQKFYIDKIKTVLPEAVEFAAKLVHCCEMMTNIMKEFQNFKKPQKLREMVLNLSHAEDECDELYLRAAVKVPDHCTEVLDIIFWREIYECMEAAADACEHVGDCIETVVMKNT